MRSTSHMFIFKARQLKLVFCDKNKLKIVKHACLSPASQPCTERDVNPAREVPGLPPRTSETSPLQQTAAPQTSLYLVSKVLDDKGRI